MTERTRRTEGSPDRDEAADSGEATMDRFKSLARRLLYVSHNDLAAEQQKAKNSKIKWQRKDK
jgi:hypothetical protein